MTNNNWNWASRISQTTGTNTNANLSIDYTHSNTTHTYLACRFSANIGLYNSNNTGIPDFSITRDGFVINTVLIKCNNTTGDFEWYAKISSSGNCQISFIKSDSTNIYVSGTFRGTPVFANASSGNYANPPSGLSINDSVFVAKLDDTGTWLSVVSSKASPTAATTSILQMDLYNGYVYVSLSINNTTTLYNNTNTGAISNIPYSGGGDAVIAKTNLVAWQWATRIADTNFNSTSQMYLSSDSVYVTGFYVSTQLGFYDGNLSSADKTLSRPLTTPATVRCIYVCKIPQNNGITELGAYVAQIGLTTNGGAPIGFSNTSITDFYVSCKYLNTAQFYNSGGGTTLSDAANVNSDSLALNKILISKINTNGVWQWFSIVSSPTTISGELFTFNNNLFITGFSSITSLSMQQFKFWNGNGENASLALTGKYTTSQTHVFNGVLNSAGIWQWTNLIAPSTEIALTVTIRNSIISGQYVNVVYNFDQSVNIYKGDTSLVTTITNPLASGTYGVVLNYNINNGNCIFFKKISGGVTPLFSNNADKFFVPGSYTTTSVSFYNDNTIDSNLTRSGVNTRNNIYIAEFGPSLTPIVPCFAYNSIKNIELPEDATIVHKNNQNSEWIEFNDNVSSPLHLTRDHLISYNDIIMPAEDTNNKLIINNDDVVDIETSDGRFITIKNVLVKTTKK